MLSFVYSLILIYYLNNILSKAEAKGIDVLHPLADSLKSNYKKLATGKVYQPSTIMMKFVLDVVTAYWCMLISLSVWLATFYAARYDIYHWYISLSILANNILPYERNRSPMVKGRLASKQHKSHKCDIKWISTADRIVNLKQRGKRGSTRPLPLAQPEIGQSSTLLRGQWIRDHLSCSVRHPIAPEGSIVCFLGASRFEPARSANSFTHAFCMGKGTLHW